MGNTLQVSIGYIIVFYLQMRQKFTGLFTKAEEKSYYSNDIILQDEEHQAGKPANLDILSAEDISNIIKKQQRKSNSNEYKMIHSSEDETNDEKDFHDLTKEAINPQSHDEERLTEENLEELKREVLMDDEPFR